METTVKNIRVYVYGTLKLGESNHFYLHGAVYEGEARLQGFDMYRLLHFPYVVRGTGIITVQSFKVDNQELDRLDTLEGYPHHYDRVEVEAAFGKGFLYCYRKKGPTGRLVPSGNWLGRKKTL